MKQGLGDLSSLNEKQNNRKSRWKNKLQCGEADENQLPRFINI